MATNKNKGMTEKLSNSDPAQFGVAITPNDGADLPFETRGIFVGGAGTVVVQMFDGTNVAQQTLSFVGCVAGSILPIRAQRVMVASTATNLVALF